MLQNVSEHPCKWTLVGFGPSGYNSQQQTVRFPHLHALSWTAYRPSARQINYALQDLFIFSSFRLSGEVLTSSVSTVIPQFTVCVQNAHNTSCHWTDKYNNERGLVTEGLNDLLWEWTNFFKVFVKKSSSSQLRAIKKPKPHWVKITTTYFREINQTNRSWNSDMKREEIVSFTQNPMLGSILLSALP